MDTLVMFFVERKLTMCRLFENVVTLSAMEQLELACVCVCNLVWRKAVGIATHCIVSYLLTYLLHGAESFLRS